MRARLLSLLSMSLGAVAWIGCAGSGSTTGAADPAPTSDAGADTAPPPSGGDSGTPTPGTDSAPPTGEDAAPTDAGPVDAAPADAGPSTACAPAPTGWRPMAAPPLTAAERFGSFAFLTWSGKEVFLLRPNTSGVTAYAYDPARDTWRSLAAPPFRLGFRGFAVSQWTGSQWLLYGGWPANNHGDPTSNDPGGFLYDPATDTWSVLDRPALTERWDMTGAWDEAHHSLLMFGGAFTRFDGAWTEYADGARFDVATKTWSKMADAPFAGVSPRVAWSAGKLVAALPARHVTPEGKTTSFAAAATYDPTTNTWASIAAPPGDPTTYADATAFGPADRDFALWFSLSPDAGTFPGAGRYWDPNTGTWSTIPSLTATAGVVRAFGVHWAANGKLYAWGGDDVKPDYSSTPKDDGASFDPVTGVVTPMPTDGAPSTRVESSSLWTGCDAIVLGGFREADGETYTDGRRFRP